MHLSSVHLAGDLKGCGGDCEATISGGSVFPGFVNRDFCWLAHAENSRFCHRCQIISTEVPDPQFYLAKNGNTAGPFTEAHLREMLVCGAVTGDDFVWNDSFDDWVALSQVIVTTQLPPIPISTIRSPGLPTPSPVDMDSSGATQMSKGSPNPDQHPASREWMKEYFSLNGRIGRAKFIIRITILWVICSVVMFLSIPLATISPSTRMEPSTLALIYGIMMFSVIGASALITIFQAGKRLHDCNASAGWVFALSTGIGAILIPVLLVFRPGTVEANRFGVRHPTSPKEKLTAIIIGGMFLLFISGITINAIVDESKRHQASLTSHGAPLPNSSGQSQLKPSEQVHQLTVHGSDSRYTLTVPSDWTIKHTAGAKDEGFEAYDIVVSKRTDFVGVIAEEENLGNLEIVTNAVRDKIMKLDASGTSSEVNYVNIDDRIWSAFSVHTKTQGVPFAFQFYVYTGDEGTYQIVSWTYANLFQRELPKMDSLARSFKFARPKAVNTGLGQTSLLPESTPTLSLLPTPSTEFNKAPNARNSNPAPIDLPALNALARHAVVLITSFDFSGKEIKSGTGFFVSKNGEVATNWHVIKGASTATVKCLGGQAFRVAGMRAFSQDGDVAILSTGATSVPYLPLHNGPSPEIGTRIAVIGNPMGFEGTLSDGIISGQRADKTGQWIQMTAPISPGSSGSPVLDVYGTVLGIATLNSDGRYQAINFARPASEIRKLLTSDGTSLIPLREAASIIPNSMPVAVRVVQASPESGDQTPGDVVAVFRDGKTLQLTQGKNFSDAKLCAQNGTIGWLVNEGATKVPGDGYVMSYTVNSNGTMELYRGGKIVTRIQSKLMFIEEWNFVDNGACVALRTRQSHGLGWFQLFSVDSGKMLATVPELTQPKPKWVPSSW